MIPQYTRDTLLIRGIGKTTPAQIQAWFESKAAWGAQYAGYGMAIQPIPSDFGQVLVNECRDFGINWDGEAAQIMTESAALQSKIFRDKRNLSGYGAVDGNAYNAAWTFQHWRDSIQQTLRHLLCYAVGPDVDPRAMDKPAYITQPARCALVVAAHNDGTCRRFVDLKGKYATSPTYDTTLLANVNALTAFANLMGDSMVDISTFQPPTIIDQWFAPNGVSYLGEQMDLWGVCIHQTGNSDPGSEAQQNVNYMKSQECIDREASWHATVGLHQVIRTIPTDRQAFHASDSDGPGNTHFYAIEGVMCYPVGSPEYEQVKMNHAWYAAKVLRETNHILVPVPQTAVGGVTGAGTLGQHHNFARDQKNCPQFYRDHPGEWESFIAYATAFHEAIGPVAENDGNPWYLTLGFDADGQPLKAKYPFRRGFRGFVEGLAISRWPDDPNSAALAIFGEPKGEEFPAIDGNTYQRCKNCVLQYIPENHAPWDVKLLERNARVPAKQTT